MKRRDISEEDGTSAAGIPVFGPVPPDPQHTINRLVSENTTLRTRLAEVEADAAVMRGALEQLDCEPHSTVANSMIARGLATNAGKSLLERLKEAEVLLNETSQNWWSRYDRDWRSRRDAFLNPTNKDVK